MNRLIPTSGAIFLEGPAGTGKTTEAAQYLRRLLEAKVAPERILVLVPQRTLGRPYQLAAHEAGRAGGTVETLTLGGLAYDTIARFWPLLAERAGFADPTREPTFLTIETAQYFMARLANPAIAAGNFAGVSIGAPRVISQTFDNLNKAALLGDTLEDVQMRLTGAWADRHSSRPQVYEASRHLAEQFRAHCLAHNLIDYSLAIQLFSNYLLSDRRFSVPFFERYAYLIADNIEEDHAASHAFIRWALPHLEGALLIYDADAGYRVFLGADADGAYNLSAECDEQLTRTEARVASPAIVALTSEFSRLIGPEFVPFVDTDDDQAVLAPEAPKPKSKGKGKKAAVAPPNPLDGFRFETHAYYPQMITWTADQVIRLVREEGVAPRQIAVLAPYLNDSLRFSLVYRLEAAGIPTLTHRPSRALRDEPAVRAMLTLARLAYPTPTDLPPPADVADALAAAIADLDPVRARLLAAAVYGTGRTELGAFDKISAPMQSRITYRMGERYEALRAWLAQQGQVSAPLDHFFRRLFGEVLAQPGYGFHGDVEAGRVIAQLIGSAQTFRTTLYPDFTPDSDWSAARQEYFDLIGAGLLATLHAASWNDETIDAVFIAPATTFLLRNRFVDYQFWLDVGNGAWGERLDQPLTNPYVLRSDFPPGAPWTDALEEETGRSMLYRVIVGLARRCRKQIYLGIADLGEEGAEERGLLLNVFQRVIGRHQPPVVPETVPEATS